MAKRSITFDMTVGNPIKIILMFALPIFLGNIFQQFYSMVDTIIVGYKLGDDAIAAVGATGAISSLIVGFANGMNNGFSMVISRRFGAKDNELMKKAIGGTMVLGIATAILLTVVSLIFIMPLLRFLNTPEEIIGESYSYIKVILAGIIVTMLYNMGSGILRAVGNSRVPLLVLVATCLLNAALDLLFVAVLGLGVSGAAYATIISQAISVILVFGYIIKKCPELRISKKDLRISAGMMSDLMSAGISMGLMLSIVSIGSVALQAAINELGKTVITAHTAARKISEMCMLTMGTIATAASTYTSQNYGAKKYSRVREGVIKSVGISWVWSAFCILLIYTIAPIMVKLITGTDQQEVIETASLYLKINLPFYFVLGILLILRSSMQGVGIRIMPLFASGVELAGKFVVAFILVPKLDYLGVCISEPITWILCSLLLVISLFTNSRARVFTKSFGDEK